VDSKHGEALFVRQQDAHAFSVCPRHPRKDGDKDRTLSWQVLGPS